MKILNRMIAGVVVLIIILLILIAVDSNAANDAKINVYKGDNVPTLSPELKKYTYSICKKYSIDPKILIGLMYVESGFRANALTPQGDIGICQIRTSFYKEEIKYLKIDNMRDPKQNINLASFILSRFKMKYDKESYHITLMCYNLGERGAQALWKKKVYSTEYTRSIIKYANSLK